MKDPMKYYLHYMGMEKLLRDLIAALPVSNEEEYIKTLRKDLETTRKNYSNRY